MFNIFNALFKSNSKNKNKIIYLYCLVIANRCLSPNLLKDKQEIKLDDLKNILRDATRYFYCAESDITLEKGIEKNTIINWQQANNILLKFELHCANKKQVEKITEEKTRNNLIFSLNETESSINSILFIESHNYIDDPNHLLKHDFKRI